MSPFISQPHLPTGAVRLVLCDPAAKNYDFLSQNTTIVQSYQHNNILNGISGHPDMTFCPLGGNLFVVAPEAYGYYLELLSHYGIKLIKGKRFQQKEYPLDIALNCVILDGKLFHLLTHTDDAILSFAKEKGWDLIHTKQGYTKCATLIVDHNSVITADYGLHKIYCGHGINSLKITNDKIGINGFTHGFIGGAGGKISPHKMAFFGDITRHPDYGRIRDFLEERGICPVSLSFGPLYDHGSLIPLIEHNT